MIAFDVSQLNKVIGSYRDTAGVEHGFLEPLDGSNYTTFDLGGSSTGTEPRGFGYHGSIVGVAPTPGFSVGQEFLRKPNGAFSVLRHGGTPLDGVLSGLNGLGAGVGDYYDATGTRNGYLGVEDKFKKNFRLRISGYLQNSPRGIDHNNDVAGYFIDAAGAQHGFVQNASMVQVVDYPSDSAVLAALEAINDGGDVSGQWNDAAGNAHAFVLHLRSSSFIDLNPNDGSSSQQAWGVNGKGFVAMSTNSGAAYIYCPYLEMGKCPAGGAARHLPDRRIRVANGTFFRYDARGRTDRHLPAASTIMRSGAPQ
ncbi:MAG: hypothetical protein JOY77_11620 [Alphaproteobacteria bacterium]|nr:hypothetical protein [Alphaproteobacteria bacterium]